MDKGNSFSSTSWSAGNEYSLGKKKIIYYFPLAMYENKNEYKEGFSLTSQNLRPFALTLIGLITCYPKVLL